MCFLAALMIIKLVYRFNHSTTYQVYPWRLENIIDAGLFWLVIHFILHYVSIVLLLNFLSVFVQGHSTLL